MEPTNQPEAEETPAARKPPSVGAEVFFCQDFQATLAECRAAYMDFAVVPLVHPRLERLPNSTLKRARLLGLPLARNDTLLDSHQWSTAIVGRISRWVDLDSPCDATRCASETAIKEEFALATHLSLSAILLPPVDISCANYARQVNQFLVKSQQGMNVWLEVPHSRWDAWNRFRTLCDFASALQVALRLDVDAIEASTENDEIMWERWYGEPVKAVLLRMGDFVPNNAGYPTLPPKARRLVVRLYERNAQFILTGRPRHANGFLPYQMYLAHLCSKGAAPVSIREHFESAYYDYLQIPLQPLGDNLESQTYETFERDPVKYARYEEGVKLALIRAARESPPLEQLVVMVVGAGRGPLIRASLRGARSAGLDGRVRIIGVEKNPNAVVTLLNLFPRGNPDGVEIVPCDMREWKTEIKADVIVSELLGSWGDNELSPECLAGVEQYLKKPHGVSVPYFYESFIAPIMSHKVWSEVRNLSKGPTDVDPSTAASGVQRFETPYVVRLHNFFHVAEPVSCFGFDQRIRTETDELLEEDGRDVFERYIAIPFVAKEDALVHGFAGYFTAKLFGEVTVSIHPNTFSDQMTSWFPLFLPLRNPVFVKKHEAMRALVWRKRSQDKVWYEWALETQNGGQITPIHNPTGRSYAVNM